MAGELRPNRRIETPRNLVDSFDIQAFQTNPDYAAAALLELEGFVYRIIARRTHYFLPERRRRELIQDVLLKAWKSHSEFRGDSSIQGWLATVTRNAIRDYVRSSMHKQETDEGLGYSETRDLYEYAGAAPAYQIQHIWRQELRQRIELAMQKLSQNHREVLELYYFEEMTYPEIAAYLDIPLGTVMSRLFYAKQKIEPYLKNLDT